MFFGLRLDVFSILQGMGCRGFWCLQTLKVPWWVLLIPESSESMPSILKPLKQASLVGIGTLLAFLPDGNPQWNEQEETCNFLSISQVTKRTQVWQVLFVLQVPLLWVGLGGEGWGWVRGGEEWVKWWWLRWGWDKVGGWGGGGWGLLRWASGG